MESRLLTVGAEMPVSLAMLSIYEPLKISKFLEMPNHIKIIATVKLEFMEMGFDKSSMRNISKRCDMTAAGISTVDVRLNGRFFHSNNAYTVGIAYQLVIFYTFYVWKMNCK